MLFYRNGYYKIEPMPATMVSPNGNDSTALDVRNKGKGKRKPRSKQDESDKPPTLSTNNDTATKTTTFTGGAPNKKNNNISSSNNKSISPSKKRRRGNQIKSLPNIANGPSSPAKSPDQSSFTSHQPQPNHSRKKIPLSPAVYEFSTQLKELVRQKNLPALLQCYFSNSYDHIRDEHHACIVIDACAKGGGTDSVTTGSINSNTNNISNNSNSNVNAAEQIIAHLQQQTSSSSGATLQNNSHNQRTLSSFNVETLTALLKVYVHAGNLQKGWELFGTQILRPNVRTLNTLLRGCLWSAVTVTNSSTIASPSQPVDHIQLHGGVVTGENAWQHYLTKQSPQYHSNTLSNDNNSTDVITMRLQQVVDTSSYEYSIQLLCQSLQVGHATKRIDEYCTIHNIRFKGTAKIIQNSSTTNDSKNSLTITSSATIFETLAVVYLALSRAYAIAIVLLLPMEYDTSNYSASLWTSCQRCLSAIKLSRVMLLKQHSSDATLYNDNNDAAATTNMNSKTKTAVTSAAGTGGKRGWKTGQQHQQSTQREFSNVAYRTHRLSELELDVLSLLKHCRHKNAETERDASNKCDSSAMSSTEKLRLVAQQLQKKLLYFSGGAVTSTMLPTVNVQQRQASKQKRKISTAVVKSTAATVRQQLLVASWYSFGMAQIFSLIMKNKDIDLDASTGEDSNSIDEDYNRYAAMQSAASSVGTSVIDDNGMMNMEAIFTSNDRPLDIEIGAGFGTWIVDQAKRNNDRNYIAMELRADRCYQIYTRAMLHHTELLPNVCVVGCDCNILLRERISRGTVSTFYAHHPEPPTQVSGDNVMFLNRLAMANNTSVVEPVHMLHSTTILYMCHCLKKNGYIVIVSDNRSYIRLVAATFTKVVREHVDLLRTVSLPKIKKGIIQGFDETVLDALRVFETFQSVIDIHLYDNNMMTLNPKNGNDGTSYFDRLWRTGAGTHSETHTRFVIVMQKVGSDDVH